MVKELSGQNKALSSSRTLIRDKALELTYDMTKVKTENWSVGFIQAPIEK